MFDKQEYLDRIRIEEKAPSLSYLRELLQQHSKNIPFENLDIHYKNRIRLDVNDFFQKLIRRKRGGYCFELNGLFFHLLKALGFQAELLHSSFYRNETETYSHDFDHMMIKVTIADSSYLVDIGTIDPIVSPIKWEENQVTLIGSEYFRLERSEEASLFLKKSSDAMTFVSYLKIFTQPVSMIEFLAMNDIHQDDPNSFFVQNKIVSIVTESGRKQIKNHEMVIQEFGSIEKWQIFNEDELLTLLEQHFGIATESLINPEA